MVEDDFVKGYRAGRHSLHVLNLIALKKVVAWHFPRAPKMLLRVWSPHCRDGVVVAIECDGYTVSFLPLMKILPIPRVLFDLL